MKLNPIMATIAFAALCTVSSAYAADGGDQNTGILTYPSVFFADSRPSTAYDMIGRLPGFVFEDGNSEPRLFSERCSMSTIPVNDSDPCFPCSPGHTSSAARASRCCQADGRSA